MYTEASGSTLIQNKIDSLITVDWFYPQLKDLLVENRLNLKEEET